MSHRNERRYVTCPTADAMGILYIERGVWLSGLAIAISCSATTPTPDGTAVGSWEATESRTAADLAKAAATATAVSKGTFDLTSRHGATFRLEYEVGTVELRGKKYRTPLAARMTVVGSEDFAVSGGFNSDPMHFAGMPEDLRALEYDAQLTRGTRSCRGTTYDNDYVRVRIDGTGAATVLPDPGP